MRIVILRTWLTNIGNGFIDKGARCILREAFPSAEITEVSGYPNYANKNIQDNMFQELPDRLTAGIDINKNILKRSTEQNKDNLNVVDYLDIDVAVVPGCVFIKEALERYKSTLKKLSENNVDIIFLGGGGGDYSYEYRRKIRQFLENINSSILITRDSDAYDCYSDIFDFSYDGIDCAFYIDEWYQPPESNRSFSVHTFDKQKEPPQLSQEQEIIRPHHNPFGYSAPFHGTARTLFDRYFANKNNNYKEKNSFVSDTLEDYLFWYKNADVTYSDRIHACVPALVYGNKAQLYLDSTRDALFDNVPLEGDIKQELVSLDFEKFNQLKIDQVNTLSKFVSKL